MRALTLLIVSTAFWGLNAQNVGVGTTNPTEKLHVQGNLRLDSAFMPGNNPGKAGQILISQGPNIPPKWDSLSNIIPPPPPDKGDTVCSSVTINMLQKWTGLALCNSIIFDNGTQIGINTTSPAATVDINGNLRVRTLPTSVLPNNLVIADNTGMIGSIAFSGNANDVLRGDGTWAPVTASGGVSTCGTVTANYIQKWTGTDLCNSIIYEDNTTFKIGIGTSTPQAKLDIAGDLRIQTLSTSLTKNSVLIADNTGVVGALPFSGNSTDVLRGDGTWAPVSTASTDADWYKKGTTTPPSSINDSIYTNGWVGINSNPPRGILDIYGDGVWIEGTNTNSSFNAINTSADLMAITDDNKYLLNLYVTSHNNHGGLYVRAMQNSVPSPGPFLPSNNTAAIVEIDNYASGPALLVTSYHGPNAYPIRAQTDSSKYTIFATNAREVNQSRTIYAGYVGATCTSGCAGILTEAYNSGVGNGSGIIGIGGWAGVWGRSLDLNNSPVGTWAGYFTGNVKITDSLHVVNGFAAGVKHFLIDHPLDPENKYLKFATVEAPEYLNIFRGSVVTDTNGYATVELPDYFWAANTEPTVHLTVEGTFAQAVVWEPLQENSNKFVVRTDKPNVKVNWVVYARRNDPYVQKHPLIVEMEKGPAEKGYYLHPEAYGKPHYLRIGYAQETKQLGLPVPAKEKEMVTGRE
ncbi:MAG: hypothetical protein GXO48_07015 [Chlorobi bacterium]|nr:hypothetical protein [Chlorobiota bacterium]